MRGRPPVAVGEDHRAGAVGGRAGLGVADRVPEHRRGLDLFQGEVRLVEVGVGVLERVAAVLVGDEGADGVRGAGAPHVRAYVRGEEAAGAGQQRLLEGDRQGQAPHGVGLGLLLEGEGEDGAVDAGGDQVGGDQGGGAADRAGGVHPQHRFADGAERVGEVQLGHHHALEEVGRLADDHGVDVRPGQLGVVQGASGGLADESGEGDVAAGGDVLGLADADDGHGLLAHRSPSRTATRFCCRQGPEVAWARARSDSPRWMRAAASPRRIRPGGHDGVGGQRAAGRVDPPCCPARRASGRGAARPPGR